MTAARRWGRRVLVAVVSAVVTVPVSASIGLQPDPVPLALLVVLVVAVCSFLVDAGSPAPTRWYADPVHTSLAEGRDAATSTNLRTLVDHQAARHPDATLRDRLVVLADQALLARHGVHVHSPAGRALLGPEVDEVLHGPVARLTPPRTDEVLRRLEEL